jgi:hypothetical protein
LTFGSLGRVGRGLPSDLSEASVSSIALAMSGGVIWGGGMVVSRVASSKARFAISYGLSGSSPVAALGGRLGLERVRRCPSRCVSTVRGEVHLLFDWVGPDCYGRAGRIQSLDYGHNTNPVCLCRGVSAGRSKTDLRPPIRLARWPLSACGFPRLLPGREGQRRRPGRGAARVHPD